jgi:type I restriction-modification system DNA methylase subunit
MSFFQNSVINKYIKALDKQIVSNAYSKFKEHFHNSAIQENIRNSKEEQYQGEFLIDLFVSVLGYTKNPTPNFNLTTEYKNLKDSKKADGAIIIKDVVKAVIELKGTNTTDLNKIETQAFGYKNNQPECEYVITSNFEKLRFYMDNAIEYIEFNLFTLTEKEFELLYVCLAFENIEKGLPKKIKSESVSQEDTITKKLYNDYSVFKKELYHNLVALNPQYQALDLFKISQKLLDRFLFIFFAEDRALLPTNLIFRINKEWQQLREMRIEVSLYDRYKIYFHDLNVGATVSLPAFNETKASQKEDFQIFAYNGGLFHPDDILNAIKIDDAILFKHTENLSNYDFSSEVDVNILGHIFENSLNELDELKAQVEGQEIDKTKTKRKKDGVFYTPKYITKYIVENTIGKLCQDKKAELQINDEDYFTDKKRQKATKQALSDKLTQYRNWLLQLTICDPACGSGAFLNQALDFLIAEHRYIDELHAKLFGDAMVLSDIEKSILENNLFGVDINEESVEIAKLSLWLRTAQPNRKLNDLNDNIKCGNSLIDDENVAGHKAFNWTNEFKSVFAKGGFDVIIGNPPYVFARDNFKQDEKDFYVKNYLSAKYQINTYLLFIEKSVQLIKTDGVYGLIIPNSWLMVYSGEGLRKYLLETCCLNQIINLEGYSFESANVETVILIAQKNNTQKENIIKILLNNGSEFYFSHNKEQKEFKENDGSAFKVFMDVESDEINTKIFKNSDILDNLVEIKAGLQAYEKDKGEPKQSSDDVKNRPYDYNFKFDESTYKYLDGKDVGRYSINWSGLYLRYGKHLAAPRTFNLFDGKKIIVREITGNYPKCLISVYSEDLYLYNRSNIGIVEKANSNISLKYIQSILNSKLISYYFLKNTAKSVRKLFPKIILNDLRKFPIKKISISEQNPFIESSELMLNLNKQLQECSQKFQKSLERKFEMTDLPNKLQNWYLLSYSEFIKELAKKKIKLSLGDEAEWETYFTAEAKKALDIKAQIDKTDKEIDQMVYKLYDLTEEEIMIVEGG